MQYVLHILLLLIIIKAIIFLIVLLNYFNGLIVIGKQFNIIRKRLKAEIEALTPLFLKYP